MARASTLAPGEERMPVLSPLLSEARFSPPPEGPKVPAHLDAAGRLAVYAASEIQPLTVLTAVNSRQERERLEGELRAGLPTIPRWKYVARDLTELRRVLDAAEGELTRTAETPLDFVYRDRVRELALDASMCAAVGTPRLAELARRRFAARSASEARAASALATDWLDGPAIPAPARTDTIASDAADPRSLLSLMRAAVGRLGLPFSVTAIPALLPLAATGASVIFVATGRLLTEEDARRTVLHEVLGHASPRARAAHAGCMLFRAGTARGTDDQEGRAILIEERAGLLGAKRRRQLAARHRAVETMTDGACFGDVVSVLMAAHGVDPKEAVIIAERVFRGADGTTPGLGRERVYLPAFLRVRAHLAAKPEDDRVLASGQVSLEALDALRPFAPAEEGPAIAIARAR